MEGQGDRCSRPGRRIGRGSIMWRATPHRQAPVSGQGRGREGVLPRGAVIRETEGLEVEGRVPASGRASRRAQRGGVTPLR